MLGIGTSGHALSSTSITNHNDLDLAIAFLKIVQSKIHNNTQFRRAAVSVLPMRHGHSSILACPQAWRARDLGMSCVYALKCVAVVPEFMMMDPVVVIINSGPRRYSVFSSSPLMIFLSAKKPGRFSRPGFQDVSCARPTRTTFLATVSGYYLAVEASLRR